MNVIFLVILLCTLLVSTLISIGILKNRKNQERSWMILLITLFLNTLILVTATAILYKTDVQVFHKQTEGWFDSLGVLVLIFFIPIITFINIFILKFVGSKTFKNSKSLSVINK